MVVSQFDEFGLRVEVLLGEGATVVVHVETDGVHDARPTVAVRLEMCVLGTDRLLSVRGGQTDSLHTRDFDTCREKV